MSDWVCSGCGRHFRPTLDECPYCRETMGTVTYKKPSLKLPLENCVGCENLGTAAAKNKCKTCRRYYCDHPDKYKPYEGQ